MHFFTSITANYLPKARVLAKSVKKHNEGAVFHLMLSDKVPDSLDLSKEPFDSLYTPDMLGIDGLNAWIFEHSVVELCTAVKGFTFLKILEDTDADKVIYLDPDIAVLSPLDELSAILDKENVVLTPHQVEPETAIDAIRENEICSLKHGVYNLGFLAVRRGAGGIRFLKWWSDRLKNFCHDDIPGGIFTDQRWVDLAPAFFDDIYVLRDKCYNVATWNLTHRKVERLPDGNLGIEGSPIKFYHFSGFDSGAQEIMLKKYAPDSKELFELRDWYIDATEKEGQSEIGSLPSVYGFYSNGEKIQTEDRIIYRKRADLREAFPDPINVPENEKSYFQWLEIQRKSGQLDDVLISDSSSLKRLTELKSKVAELTKSEALLAKKCENRDQELKNVYSSLSWRVTKPLRTMKAFLNRGRNDE